MVNSTGFLWPQTNRKLMQRRIQNKELPNLSLNEIQQIIVDLGWVIKCIAAFLGFGNFRKIEEEIMYFFNGSNTQKLSNKYDFLNLCSKLGYHTPKQILIAKNDSLSKRVQMFKEEFNEDGFGFYLKPVSGYAGKGIRVLKTREEVESILDNISGDYIIEEAVNINKEFRYILYIDPDWNKWHMAFEKTRSYIIGDGKSTLATLVLKSNIIPTRRKLILMKKKFFYLKQVLAKGEKIQLENTCSYGKLPSELEINALDKIIPNLIFDLEKNIGHKLPILCFDLGVTSPLKNNLTLSELMKIVIPFECQMPFSPLAHFKFMKNGFGPFFDFYRMLYLDMMNTINKRIEKNKGG